MTNIDLFHLLKKESAELHSSYGKELQSDSSNEIDDSADRSFVKQVTDYNQKIWREILTTDGFDEQYEIDLDTLIGFTRLLREYLEYHATNRTMVQQYVRIISVYLTFVAKKPLHPPGMVFAEGNKLLSSGSEFYCPIKKHHLDRTPSLCSYCVSKPAAEYLQY
jgi:uncharacterized protein (UPF0305 family)